MSVYLTPAAIGYMTQLILAALISGYFLALAWQPRRPQHILWLAGFVTTLTGFIALLFLEAVLPPTPRLSVVFLQNTLLGVALMCLLQFAYRFPTLSAPLRREARLALGLSGLYTLWEGGYAVFRFAQLRAGVVEYRPPWSDYALLLFLLWTPLAFLRKIYALPNPLSLLLAREGGSALPSPRRRGDGGEVERRVAPLLHPPSREARASRSFAAIFLFVAGLSVFNILRSTYLLPVSLANMGISVGILIALFAFAVVYLDYRPGTTSFMIKLVGVTLTVMLAVLGVVGWVVSPLYETRYRPVLPDQRTLRFTPNDAGGYDVTEVPFAFEADLGDDLHLTDGPPQPCSAALDFAFPFYGQAYSQIYACNDGALGIGQAVPYRAYQYRYGAGAPLILPLLTDLYPEISPGGVFARQETERLIVTWDRLRGFRQQQAEFTFQAILYPDGVFDITYNGLPERLAFHPNDDPGASLWAVGTLPGGLERNAGPQAASLTDLPLRSGPDGVVQDYVLEFRRYLHAPFVPLAWLILAASALIVVGFPLLFHFSLVSPLNALLRGVRRMEAGDYSVNVPVQYTDEVGFLTRAFNALVAQLGDLIRNLEARVAERTQALTEANARLRAEMIEREEAQAQVLEQQRELAALEEREHMGRELHDGLGQVMGYVNLEAQAAQALLAEGQTLAAQASLERLAQVAKDAHADVRDFILGLRAAVAREQNLYDTLRACLRQFSQTCGVEATLSVPQDAPASPFAPAVEEQVLRIVQEALTNVRKHAQAHRVELFVFFTADQAQVIVADDGVGFDASRHAGELGGHFGLSIMRERAAQVGGQLEIRSASGWGTQVLLSVPRGFAATSPESGDLASVKGLRVLLVDDHPLFLDGLRNLLLARGMAVVGLARDGIEAQEQARLLRPDVVVMDVQMPRCDGLEATRAIKAELPETKIVMLTVSEDEEHLFEAIKSGASGYLLKSLDANEFCALLAGLARGETPLAPGLAVRVLAEFARRDTVGAGLVPAQGDHEGRPYIPTDLTPRQWEILQRVAQGQMYKEIGAALSLAERTVKYHMGQILERLHLESREQAIAYARRARGR